MAVADVMSGLEKVGGELVLGVGPEGLPWVASCFRVISSAAIPGDCPRPGALGDLAVQLATLLNFTFRTEATGVKLGGYPGDLRLALAPLDDRAAGHQV